LLGFKTLRFQGSSCEVLGNKVSRFLDFLVSM
jgi:hypothetical protein